ncbi:MAG: hypothetical protein ABWJ42_06120 [Sulfolobales archaeon]
MKSLAKIFVLVYLSIAISLYLYHLTHTYLQRFVVAELSSEYVLILQIVIISLPASIIITLLIRSVSSDLQKNIFNLYTITNRLSTMVDAYALVLKQYEEELSKTRDTIDSLKRRSDEINIRISAVEKLLPALIEMHGEKES